jgi:hypothetical protein
MNRLGTRRRAGPSIRIATIAWAALLLGILPELRGEPPPASEKPTQIQLQSQFDQAESVRAGAAQKTKERADAAKVSMKIASDIGWLAFDAGKYEEAANWFSRSAELKAESHDNLRAYWEESRRTEVAQTEVRLGARIEELQSQLAGADESKKATLKTSIDALEEIRYSASYSALSMLEIVARENDASADLVEYGKQELELLRGERAYLLSSGAAKHDVDLKNAQIATALEVPPARRRTLPPSMSRKKTTWQPWLSDRPCRRRCQSGSWKTL